METDDHSHSDSHLQPIESCQLIQPVCHGLREETGTAELYWCHFNWECFLDAFEVYKNF